MSDISGYWVNVDFTTKICTLHAPSCIYEMNKAETNYKGIGQLKRDGGWLQFESAAEAEMACRKRFPKLTYKKCEYYCQVI